MELIDLKEKEVFQKQGRGMANLIDEPCLQINQACLEPGQEVPLHQANSHVTITVTRGEGTFFIGNEIIKMGPGKLLRVTLQTPMSIKNESSGQLVFLVIKTPHPGEITQ